MSERNYWLDLFTGKTWEEFLDAGAQISGFRESRWTICQKVKPGDYLLCYITGISRFIGIIEITSSVFRDDSSIWADDVFPVRFRVKLVCQLTFETAVPVYELKNKLSFFENMNSPTGWTGRFRGSPSKWSKTDGKAVYQAILDAKRNPIKREVNKRKLMYRPKTIKTKKGSVTVPDREMTTAEQVDRKAPRLHTEIQWTLLKLGNDMGFDIWVARNDRGREYNGNRFSKLPNLKEDLPLQFDDATNKTIELIDVLWLKGNAIVAAFEIESSTSIYSGLLRMSDLVTMQPNINIPLYLVAPDDRREKVMTEVNRPTFTSLTPPLYEICRYISFSSLKEQIAKVSTVLQYLKPEFLEEISETCEIEEA
jgi:hypothetical protein